MINTNYATTEINQVLNFTQKFKHLLVDIFLLCAVNVLLTFKIKFVLDSITHITQQQSQLLMYVRTRKKKQEQRNNNTYINNNLRGMALDGRIICIKREEAKCY